MKPRGYFGIGIWGPKHEENVGTLFRSAVCFNASFIFTIGRKYKQQCTDTVNSNNQIPCYRYLNIEEFIKNIPNGCQIVCVEIANNSRNLVNFCHPERTVYILGNETMGIPKKFMEDKMIVEIPTNYCLNVASAGTVVMYDRISKSLRSQ